MPTKRRLAKGRQFRIMPEAVEAYRNDDWGALHDALGLKTWESSPLWADQEESIFGPGTGGSDSWPQARQLREQLEQHCSDAQPQQAKPTDWWEYFNKPATSRSA